MLEQQDIYAVHAGMEGGNCVKKRIGKKTIGIQSKTIFLVLVMLFAMIAVFMAISAYQNKMLVQIVGDTKNEQQQAIYQTSEETMHQLLEESLVKNTELQAAIANSDFTEVINNTSMLQTMAQGLFESRDTVVPAPVAPPDPAKNGTVSAKVLVDEGVDYTESRYIGIAAQMSNPMIAMLRNSNKIEGCYIGLEDGTFLCVDDKDLNKFDADGNLIPFPARERPWYRGAVESGSLYFTGIIADALSGKLMITCSAPVIVEGQLFGAVGIDIILDSMYNFIQSSSGSDSFAFIVNQNGQVILAPNNNGLFKAELSETAMDLRKSGHRQFAEFVKQALQETTELTAINMNERQYYMAGAPMPSVGWAVISVVDKNLTERPARQMLAEYDKINEIASTNFREGMAVSRQTSRWIVLGIVLISIFAAFLTVRRIVKPIVEMTKNISNRNQTGEVFEMKDVYRTHDEIEVLAEAFEDLSKKTKKYIEDITEITREKERIGTELDLARRIQADMLPHIFPPFPARHEFDIYASMDPAREVGGDFYDFFLIDNDHLCMVIADVSGKGVPAALFMMASKIMLQSYAMLGQSVPEILSKTNDAICSNNQEQMFITVWLGILEISTGIIRASNAGHEYPALMKNGVFSLLKDKHGLVIGGMEGIRYREYEIRLEPGDKLFLYTDGVPEATDANEQMLGTERMIQALNADPDASPEQVLDNVRREVDAFVNGAEQFDDLTMLCIEYRGSQEPAPAE